MLYKGYNVTYEIITGSQHTQENSGFFWFKKKSESFKNLYKPQGIFITR